MTPSSASASRRRILNLSAGAAIALAAVTGLSACNGGAQTPYPERTSSGTPEPGNDEVTPLPEPPSSTATPSPVPTTVDESDTLDG